MVLLEKLPDGTIREFRGGLDNDMELTDGSLVNDIPSQGLAELFNATFFLVDQVNPHIAPFFFNAQGSAGSPSGWRKSTGTCVCLCVCVYLCVCSGVCACVWV